MSPSSPWCGCGMAGWLVPDPAALLCGPSGAGAWMLLPGSFGAAGGGWGRLLLTGWGCTRSRRWALATLCSGQVLPDHVLPELVPPPSSVRTLPFGAAQALWEVSGTSGASRVAPLGVRAFRCAGLVKCCCAEV